MAGSHAVTTETAPRRSRLNWRLPLAVLIALAVAGAILFQVAVRPQYLTVTTHGVGPERQSLAVTYPADWIVNDSDTSHYLAEGNELRTVTWLSFAQKPTTGLQRWLDQHVFGLSDFEMGDAHLTVVLQRLDGAVNMSHESERLASGFNQLANPNCIFRMRNTVSPLGPMIELDVQEAASGKSRETRAWFIYPMLRNGEPQYEISLRYQASAHLKSRMHQVALDVVSRLRLVKGQ